MIFRPLFRRFGLARGARPVAPAGGARQPRLRPVLLILFGLTCIVANYSAQATHFKGSRQDAFTCPKCFVEKNATPALLRPALKAVAILRTPRFVNVTHFNSDTPAPVPFFSFHHGRAPPTSRVPC